MAFSLSAASLSTAQQSAETQPTSIAALRASFNALPEAPAPSRIAAPGTGPLLLHASPSDTHEPPEASPAAVFRLVYPADPAQAALTPAPLHLDLRALIHQYSQQRVDSSETEEGPEHYHWKGLLWQSFAFFGVENAFRLATDPYFRHLTADGPFWHNYIASFKQWNIRRWSDGDDFLVAWIGHPQQGAVTGFIEIQNDPAGRDLRFGNNRAYWHSRFRALLWANLFSIDQKVGPLGETALGNEGGYTYVLHCPFPCPGYKPGMKYTNNTGMVKFISTPVGGTLWIVGEDLLDRYVSDRIQERWTTAGKVVRGAINPTRTFANAMRGRKPWYRDYEHRADFANRRAVHFYREDDEYVRRLPPFEIYPHFTAFSLPVSKGPGCVACRSLTPTMGISFARRLTRNVDFDADVSYLSHASPASSTLTGGNATYAVFGLRTGIQTRRYALKVSLRPGFISYDSVLLPNKDKTAFTAQTGRVTHFATNLTISGDYTLGRHFALRSSIGNTPVRYGTPLYQSHRGAPPYLTFLSGQSFATNENWIYETGPVFRF